MRHWATPWLMSPATTLCPLRPAAHFTQRLHERLPEVKTTEGEIQRALTQAEWYPAGGHDGAYYALCRLGGRRVALVVALERGIAHLVTVYEPKPGWDKRLGHARPWPYELVAMAGGA